jgi:uncharacterized Zn finger protein
LRSPTPAADVMPEQERVVRANTRNRRADTMLGKLITRVALEALAGGTAFRRGEEYFAAAAVSRLRDQGSKVSASVKGTETYRVELWADDGALASLCTCPRAGDGYFCKHCVAVGLAWISENPSASSDAKGVGSRPVKTKRRDPWQDMKRYLSAQTVQTLTDLLLDVAQRDDRLYQSLLLKAERQFGGGQIEEAFRRAIDDSVRIRGFIDWREAGTYAGNVEQVAQALAELLKPDTAPALVDLSEYAIEQIETALEQVDDSNGEVGSIVLGLGELHLKACKMARADPIALAERLFRYQTTLPFGLCSFDAATYRPALGKEGLRRYREVAEAQWRKIGPRTDDRGFDAHRNRITGVMEKLAEMDGSIDELIAIKAKDLSSSYRYFAIAEVLTKAKRNDEALEWAERGLKAFPDHLHDALRSFLVTAYLGRRRNDDALRLTWNRLEKSPGLESYKQLHAVATKLGVWPAQRERALAWLEEASIREAASTTRWRPHPSPPCSTLRVAIALWEEDLDAAWAAAQVGICERTLLITLAGKLEKGRAADAISLYRHVIPAIVGATGNSAYEEGARLVRKIGNLLKQLNRSGEFGACLAELRVQFKAKRNFIKLLDGVERDCAR